MMQCMLTIHGSATPYFVPAATAICSPLVSVDNTTTHFVLSLDLKRMRSDYDCYMRYLTPWQQQPLRTTAWQISASVRRRHASDATSSGSNAMPSMPVCLAHAARRLGSRIAVSLIPAVVATRGIRSKHELLLLDRRMLKAAMA